MPPLRGLIFKVCVIPTADAVGYCYIAPMGLCKVNLPAYIPLIFLLRFFDYRVDVA
jgi:hypothetical protein